MKAILWVSLSIVLLSARILAQDLSQPAAQYRGFWVDTFNTALNHHNDVLAVVNNAKLANCNALFVQVRRRGDSWYRNTLEPMADRTPIEAGFDPLADLIVEAHARGLEVHAFVIVGALWNRIPTGAAAAPPEHPNHAFNRHGFNQATGKLYEGRDNWLTRTLLPDDNNITFEGHRIGNDFWIDLGQPDAAQYTYDVLLHLVRNYALDGLHLDRIRYPEVAATLAGGANIGYNETSVARFHKRYGIAPGTPPAPSDARWQQWRRDQVTNFVRRVYLNALALKPTLKVSAALIAFGGGPTTEAAWPSAEAYWRVFQDWRAWTEEGILDLIIPMNYKREHVTAQVPLLDTWAEWTKNHAYERATLHGLGVYLNSIEGTLRQIRKAIAPSTQGNRSQGVVFYSLANSNEAVTNNPLSFPPNQNTPRRSFADFAAGLTTSRSADSATVYEDQTAHPAPVFAQPAPVPALAWKTNPQTGHVMGISKTARGEAVDSAEVLIARVTDDLPPKGRSNVRTATDGNGFYGGVDLAPGRYRVTVMPVGEPPYTPDATVTVAAGMVTSFDVLLDRGGPVPYGAATVSAASFSGPTLAPESIVAAFGNGLATATQAATGLPLPTTLAATTVKLKDSRGVERAAPLFFVSPGQINYLLPADAAEGPASVLIEVRRDGLTATVLGNTLNLVRAAPGLFTANANGSGVPAAYVLRIKADGTQAIESVAQFDPAQNKFVVRPIEPGAQSDQVFLILFGTGIRGRSALSTVTVRLGGANAEVLFAGALEGFAGLDQVNLRLPRSLLQTLAGRGVTELLLFVDNRPANAVQVEIK